MKISYDTGLDVAQIQLTQCCQTRHVYLYFKTRQATWIFEIQIITPKKKFQIYVCVLVLFSDMIFWILMTEHSAIAKCGTKNCKISNILIKDAHFTSNLTNKNYFTRRYDDLNCKSANVVYGLECNICGLLYGSFSDNFSKYRDLSV